MVGYQSYKVFIQPKINNTGRICNYLCLNNVEITSVLFANHASPDEAKEEYSCMSLD